MVAVLEDIVTELLLLVVVLVANGGSGYAEIKWVGMMITYALIRDSKIQNIIIVRSR